MKVVCIKTSIEIPNINVINSDLSEYLTIGELFQVYGIRIDKGIFYGYLFNGEHLFEAPLELFKIVDDTVLEQWKVRSWNNQEITFWPNLFYIDGFFEDFAERNIEERQMFEKLRVSIET